MKRLALLALLVLLAVVALVLGVLNPGRVQLELALFRMTIPIGFALIAAFTVGMLLGVLWRTRWIASLLGERGRLRRALRLAEAQARSAENPSHDA